MGLLVLALIGNASIRLKTGAQTSEVLIQYNFLDILMESFPQAFHASWQREENPRNLFLLLSYKKTCRDFLLTLYLLFFEFYLLNFRLNTHIPYNIFLNK
jgi:hypothetical protein